MIKYAHFALCMIAVYLPSMTWAYPILAAVHVIFSIMFYWLCLNLLSGLSSSGINADIDIPEAWTSTIIHIAGTAFLFLTWDPMYQAIAIFTVPWVMINIFTNILATFVKWEIIDIKISEEDDEEL